jgi:hypothetical protein
MMAYLYISVVYFALVLIVYALLKLLSKYHAFPWKNHIILQWTYPLISLIFVAFVLLNQWKYMDLIIKDDHRICGVKKAYIHEVLPTFKTLVEDFKKDVIELLKHQIHTKSQFLKMIQKLKQQSYEIYHMSLDQQLDQVDLTIFMTCMEQKLIDDRLKALNEAEKENAQEAKMILNRYHKIEEKIEVFKRFKKSERDIRFDINKLNQQLEEKENWLNKTIIENDELIKETSIYFKANLAKILDINVRTLDPLPEFE